MKYIVVEIACRNNFEIEVNRLIRAGWKPLGGISYDGETRTYTQAMISGAKE